ncbi:MAG TPA: NADP(H)-dependent aldo-keto reductase [Thiotrichaceae bacterium]|jgi:aryl-alcohol dehydrogenase-like predicted oxidoreductase|nr:NADP(H)-dependent aldo-keto reductase [Thiotrichaceae bacterium]HIM08272.1 NADP(H)-dependent aldo-keto reductase [Gammaproteobacteria bacterium]
MEYDKLGQTDIEISKICIGTMTWGEQNTEAEAHEQLDYAIDAGITFIDTAEMYPIAPTAETQGLTETYIGNWLNSRQNRDKLVIATKVVAQQEWLPHIRNGEAKLDRKNITEALDASLKRLQTDYVDLYQIHWPERDTNFFGKLNYYHAPEKDGVTIAETLDVLDGLVKRGKIRSIGISNETAWGCAEYLRVANEQGLSRIVSIQNPYSLLNRSFEIGLSEFAHREQVGLLAYSPLGFGVLSGKYLGGAEPENSRLTLFKSYTRYSNPQAIAATEAYVALAKKNGLDPSQMALAYINSRPFVTSNIIGATTIEQLKTNIKSINVKLNKDTIRAIEAIHEKIPNPAP